MDSSQLTDLADLAALVSAGMGIAFLVADPRGRTSRALALALICCGLSIVLTSHVVFGTDTTRLPPYARLIGLTEAIGLLAAYQWVYYLRQTLPAAQLKTRFGDAIVRIAQGLVVIYAVESVLWPDMRVLYFNNALEFGAQLKDWRFLMFALPLEVSLILAVGAMVLTLRRPIDSAERTRLLAMCVAVPVICAGLVLPPSLASVTTVLGEMILLVGAIRYHVFQGERSQFLRRFLSPPVEDLVRRHGLQSAMREDTREVAVIACDLRGFTPASAQLDSSATLRLLREYYDAVGGVTSEFGATIKDYAGDGVLILLGAPLPCADADARAIDLARQLHLRLAPVLARWSSADAPLGMGIGIASGPVTVGVIGGSRLEYVAVGTPVNLAARLCDQAAPGQTLIAPSTAASSGRDFGGGVELMLKGFSGPQTAYELPA